MGWEIVKLAEVPLGRRILRLGSKGKDVCELQAFLADAGFYFGPVDGIYGVLTEEAVVLFQKTFNFRSDGIAGPEVFTALRETSSRLNRIIYSVKPRDNLKTISQKFGVAKTAWIGIPRQGNPQRKIYPGMKLLLHQKALFGSGKVTDQTPMTAYLEPAWRIGDQDRLIRLTDSTNNERYQVLDTDSQSWKRVLARRHDWKKLAGELKDSVGKSWGIDFRNAPLDTIFYWKDFLTTLRQALRLPQFTFLIFPLVLDKKGLYNRNYWLILPQISALAKLIFVEPVYNLDSPDSFLKSASRFKTGLRELTRNNLGSKTLLMGNVTGWEWNLDRENLRRKVTFREGKLMAAMNHRSLKYVEETTFTTIDYHRRKEHHCLIFRDLQGWKDWIQLGIKFNLFGYVIHDFKDLGRSGNGLILGSFAVLPQNKL